MSGLTVKVVKEYASQYPGHDMTLRLGDIITDVDCSTSPWWSGILHGVAGYFPETHVVKMEKEEPPPPPIPRQAAPPPAPRQEAAPPPPVPRQEAAPPPPVPRQEAPPPLPSRSEPSASTAAPALPSRSPSPPSTPSTPPLPQRSQPASEPAPPLPQHTRPPLLPTRGAGGGEDPSLPPALPSGRRPGNGPTLPNGRPPLPPAAGRAPASPLSNSNTTEGRFVFPAESFFPAVPAWEEV